MDKKVNVLSGDCAKKLRAIDDTMYILSGKWKMPIIARLCYGSMRYSELLKSIAGISGKMLSRELKELETNNLIEKEVWRSESMSVRYRLSEHGQTLKILTDSIADWGINHRMQIMEKW
ncbi:HxlR family transcriptional regulator [Sphingobacterium allocomposti]|uniref:HxlR family transcriptional regulator n=1 Tax=Sphingobacterium allocomposti TaxID=415956 RepID=A0A5S5DQG7_9SPHI|nr:helix-turn-helix domain-containing protein [Sphingobacterium composti Yoo et al. 2007 non Ten et al. 2007]TYP97082.1 HxlR family transcriptional regulator [Sphingobacterium composti Yoo et al. 2007 non Ten et al. 2007]HLS95719.1 helix-turn-helix domain-containing protein [Sphingobacterium sp.]